MRVLRYGRRQPAPRGRSGYRAALFMAAALDSLGVPPPQGADYVSKVPQFELYDNDKIGDCVPAAVANGIILRTANVDGTIVPALPDVVELYSKVGGYVVGVDATDNGCDEAEMGSYLVRNGFLGHQAAATGPIDHANVDHLRWSQRLFGGCRIGWNLPGYAEDLFLAGKGWDLSAAGDQSVEGHETLLVDYAEDIIKVVSWGKIVSVSLPFAMKYVEEAHAEVFPDWIRDQGVAPSGFNLSALVQKLSEVA